MRRAHTLLVVDDKTTLLFGYETPYSQQKAKVKEMAHAGLPSGGILEFWTTDGEIFRFKVPISVPPEPEQKPSKKLFGRGEK